LNPEFKILHFIRLHQKKEIDNETLALKFTTFLCETIVFNVGAIIGSSIVCTDERK
jgi:hypothetical protein